MELKLENERPEKRVGVCIGSAQRKGWGCSAKTRGYKKSWGSDWRNPKRVLGLRRENKRKEERVRVRAGGKQRNGLASTVRRKKEKKFGVPRGGTQ